MFSAQPKATDCLSSPPVPHQYLKLSKHQGPKLWKNTSSHNGTKKETKSTKRQTITPRRSHSAKTAIKRSQAQNGRATRTPSDNRLVVIGGPLAVLGAATNGRPQSAALPRRSTHRGLDSSCINRPAVLCGGQQVQSTELHADQGKSILFEMLKT